MVTSTRTKMTAEDARSFTTFSVGNAIAVKTALRCGCEPYVDVFTFARWRAQGFRVRKGQHAIRIPVVYSQEKESEDGTIETIRRFSSAPVFCRCQVQAI